MTPKPGNPDSDNRPESEPPQFNAEDLTGGGSYAQIRLQDQVYVLRITRAGKLILTK